MEHITETIATYNRIAPDYVLTNTPDVQQWEEESMRYFYDLLSGQRVLAPGCGDGRHSRFMTSLGLAMVSFDLSDGMLAIARREDPAGTYLKLDLRDLNTLPGPFDGIWASGCLYHLKKNEFPDCIQAFHQLLVPGGVFYLNMKEGQGERFEPKPLPGYPGGEQAKQKLAGNRFYAYYERNELLAHLTDFEIIRETHIAIVQSGFELWLRRTS